MNQPDEFYGLLCFASGKRDVVLRQEDLSAYAYPDLHLNLWEHGSETFLDVGVNIPCDYPSSHLHFYFPWKQPKIEAEDLISKINDASSIASIFNESWAVTKTGNSNHATVIESVTGLPRFEIVSLADSKVCSADGDRAHRVVLDVDRLANLVSSAQCPSVYVRFRVFEVPSSFYSVGRTQGDAGLVSSWTKTEDLDFRLNVRRGAPPDMEKRVGKFVEFAKVHLFLMRDRRYELAFQDSAFKACRSLEDENFWAKYSATEAEPRDTALRHIRTCFGYQWSKKADGKNAPVKEFRILARFKKTELSKRLFVCYVIVLGAAGNALWELSSMGIGKTFCTLFSALCGK